ncbi:MAG TPA: queuosine precursor transporter [Spirochaetia bacterium]|nr:queuosine precursor transporter [Spirochaetia bacterium]
MSISSGEESVNLGSIEPPRAFRWLDFFTAAFVGVLIISNIASTKILDLGLFTFDGGTILFPVAYIFGDVLTEVYGYRRSRRVIWTGFFWLAVAAAIFSIVDSLPAAPGWELQKSFHAILGQTPRIVAASMLAYFSGEFSNSYVLARMKVLTKGRWLWTRTIGSTLVGEAIDTLLFLSVAFLGVLPFPLLLSVFVSNYIFKCGVEVVLTPVTYRIVHFLKRVENEDFYDIGTNFNPFSTAALSTRRRK